MMKLSKMIADGTITVEELAKAPELIERANLVTEGLKACQKTLLFPLGADRLQCYSYTDRAGEYSSWGEVTVKGIFTCWSNWGGNHEVGKVDLTNPSDVFMAFEDPKFAHNLKRFLKEQIAKI